MLLQKNSRLVPELIPIGRDVLRLSKCDWLARERSATCFLISQSYGVSRDLWEYVTAYTLISEQTSYKRTF